MDVMLDMLIERGYFRTKTEAYRAGIIELCGKFGLAKDAQALQDELAARKIEKISKEIDEGKRKVYPLDEVLEESRRRRKLGL